MAKLSEAFRKESSYKVFFLFMVTFGLAYGLYKGIIDNYLAEVVSMTSFDKGVSEFFRELPGLMLVFILAALYMFSAEKLFESYQITVCSVIRSYSDTDRTQAPEDSNAFMGV